MPAPNEFELQKWSSARTVDDEMLWKGGYGRQIEFMRDTLVPLVSFGLPRTKYEDRVDITRVVGTHRSKSIELPVLELFRVDLGLRLIMRENFYNWKLSVMTEKPFDADFTGLFYEYPPREPDYSGDCLNRVYFEGFPRDLIFGYREDGKKNNWSAEIYGDFNMFFVIKTIMRALVPSVPMIQMTQAEHRIFLRNQP